MLELSNILKFISIILCFTIALLIGKDGLGNRDKLLLQIGLFLTVLADFCFLILNHYTSGIALFCLVQIIYYNRYRGGTVYRPPFIFIKFIIIFLSVMASYFIINLGPKKPEFLYAIALFYAICLILATIEAIKTFKNNLYPSYNRHMIVIGMVLFLLCDASIAVFNIGQQFHLPWHNIFALLIWIFYLPSQVLLSISGYQFKKKLKVIN